MSDAHLRIVDRAPADLGRFFRRHPLLAEIATIALIREAGFRAEWQSGRAPPIRLVNDPAVCPVCRLPRFAGGAWWRRAGRNRAGARWHACCVEAWKTWTKPDALGRYLAYRQAGICPETGDRLNDWRSPETDREVDHTVPLWRVALERDRHPWPDVLSFWGVRNLRALTRRGHREKTAREARERAELRRQTG